MVIFQFSFFKTQFNGPTVMDMVEIFFLNNKRNLNITSKRPFKFILNAIH